MAVLLRIDDPRTPLMRARRRELVDFARAHGLRHVTEAMPAQQIRDELMARGLTNIKIPDRPLGTMDRCVVFGGKAQAAPTVTLTQEQLNTMLAQAAQGTLPQMPAEEPVIKRRRGRPRKQPYKRLVERPRSKINLLRDECKRLKIKMERRDRMPDLERKLAEHAQDTVTSNQ